MKTGSSDRRPPAPCLGCRSGSGNGKPTSSTCRASSATLSRRPSPAISAASVTGKSPPVATPAAGSLLSEEHRLMLVARVLEIARRVDDEIQLMIRADQPASARGRATSSPLQFVDALLRSGVGLRQSTSRSSGSARRGFGSRRDLLDFSRLIDQWSLLGIPLGSFRARRRPSTIRSRIRSRSRFPWPGSTTGPSRLRPSGSSFPPAAADGQAVGRRRPGRTSTPSPTISPTPASQPEPQAEARPRTGQRFRQDHWKNDEAG